MASSSIFRESALRRLASPERLDTALTVTTPKGWFALLALSVMAGAVVVWSMRGEVSTYVSAPGVLLNRSGEVFDASAPVSGSLTRVFVSVGQQVAEGATVAETVNLEVQERHRSARTRVEERRQELAQIEKAAAEENGLMDETLARQRARLKQLEAGGRQAVASWSERLKDHRQLYDERVVTRLTVERSRQALEQARRELFGTLRESDALETREAQRRNEQERRIAAVEFRLREAERQVQEIRALIDTQRVLAPVAGRVTEIKAQVGSLLRPGQPVVSIQTGTEGLEALIFVPTADGKRVERGMDVLVSPSTVRREEHGSIRGKISSITEFPVSLQGIVAILQNRDLAKALTSEGPPYASRVALTVDPATVSGFAWTSSKGEAETLSSGTIVSAEVKVESQPPITLVVPLIKETFGL